MKFKSYVDADFRSKQRKLNMSEHLPARTYTLRSLESPTCICLSLDVVNDMSATLRSSFPREKSLDLGAWMHIRAAENMWTDAGT